MKLPQIPVIALNAKDQLLVRILEARKYWIRVMDRVSGEVISEMTSMCNHASFIKKHPTDDNSVLENCSECKVIRGYNISTQNGNIVYSAPDIVRICDGPDGSILALDSDGLLCKLKWNAETQKLRRTHVESLPLWKKMQRICYVEGQDIFVAILSNENKQIMAWKLDNGCSPTWTLPGTVDGLTIDPMSLTYDTEGNLYIDDGRNDRILKINSSTGKVLSILLLKKKTETIRCLCWSKTDRSLIVQRENRISSYFITN